MKNFRFVGMALIAVLVCANFTSCSDDGDDLGPDGGSNISTNIPTNTIYYQTTDGIIIRFDNEDVFGGAEIISNTYSTTNGYGVIEFASEVTAIEEWAFMYENTLLSIILPNSVVTIEDNAFAWCISLKDIAIGDCVKSIGIDAFNGCRGLTSITIPNSVTEIGDHAFSGCTGLKSVYVMADVPPVFYAGLFTDIYGFTTTQYENVVLYVPGGTLAAYQAADVWKEFKNMQEFDTTDIVDIVTDKLHNGAPDTYYNLRGRAVE